MISAGRGRVFVNDVIQSSVLALSKQLKQASLLTACWVRDHLPQQSCRGEIPINMSHTKYQVVTQDQSIINDCFGYG